MPAQDFLKEKNMAKFCPLFSSSSGNCIYIGTSDGGILIDAGVSAKRITGALENIGVSPDSISAIFNRVSLSFSLLINLLFSSSITSRKRKRSRCNSKNCNFLHSKTPISH